ncbi:siderophore-interacting protein [Kitasatospora sp. NPDC059088]|uniref:siderophore-interacting protein n=1 Tax=Kitasatospora sp. NPDC059088 TaxID=3346722 RepID=UPI0036A5D423
MTLPVTFIEVVAVDRITPRTARVVFEAEALDDTVGGTPDQQLKLCFPRPGQREPELPAGQDDPMGWYQAYLAIPEADRPVMRSFTLRRRHPGTRRIEVADRAERQRLATRAELEVRWLHRDGAAPGALLTAAFRGGALPGGRPFAWLAGEAGAVRALRRCLVEEHGVPKSDIDFTGYWRHRLTQDDAPTAEDLADARERLG